jgi:hypothetical protein
VDAVAEQNVRQIGEQISTVRTDFALLPQFQSFRLGAA